MKLVFEFSFSYSLPAFLIFCGNGVSAAKL